MSGPNRVILGFYAGEDEYAQKVWSAIRSITPRVQYFRSHGESQTPKPFSSRYAALRLPDEALIVAEVERDRLPSVLNILRTSGGAALFVARQKGTVRSDGISAEGAPDIQSWHTVLKRLAVYEAITREARADLLEANRLEHTVTESAKWLLDNAHLLRTSIAEIRRALPRGFRKRLSRFTARDGTLKVSELARSVVASSDHAIDEHTLVAAVEQYQKKAPLSIAELWVFPVMLRFAVVKALASLSERVNRQQQVRESAYLWSNRLAASARRSEQSLSKMLSLLEAGPLGARPVLRHLPRRTTPGRRDRAGAGPELDRVEERSFARRYGPCRNTSARRPSPAPSPTRLTAYARSPGSISRNSSNL